MSGRATQTISPRSTSDVENIRDGSAFQAASVSPAVADELSVIIPKIIAKIRFNIRSPLLVAINVFSTQAKRKITKYLIRWP